MKNEILTPKIFSILILFFLIIGISSCKNRSIITKHAPQVDLSTPENTVISYWKYQVWVDSLLYQDALIYYSNYLSVKTKIHQQLSAEEARIDFIKKHFLFPYTIEKKQKLNDSKFVIYTNETEYEYYTKIFKYVLVRENNEWKISDRLGKCETCRGTGLTDDWHEGKSVGQIKCWRCKGERWNKITMVIHRNSIF